MGKNTHSSDKHHQFHVILKTLAYWLYTVAYTQKKKPVIHVFTNIQAIYVPNVIHFDFLTFLIQLFRQPGIRCILILYYISVILCDKNFRNEDIFFDNIICFCQQIVSIFDTDYAIIDGS